MTDNLVLLRNPRNQLAYAYFTPAAPMVGDLRWSVRDEDSDGWLLCDGRALNEADYPDLFRVVGNTFGGGEGYFNLPDPRGRVAGVAGHGSGLTARSTGASVGEETHTLTIPEMPSHNHTATTAAAGGHSHDSNSTGILGLMTTSTGGYNTFGGGDHTPGEPNLYAPAVELDIHSVADHTHAVTVGMTGGSRAHNNMQPTLFIGNIFIFCGWGVVPTPPPGAEEMEAES